MQMVKKITGSILFVFLLVFVLMPKQELYYKLEHELAKEGIIIGNEKISEGWFTLKLEDASVYVKGIKVATIKEAEMFSLFFYTGVSLKEITLDHSLRSAVCEQMNEINLLHNVLNPFEVDVEADGDFGESSGVFSLNTQKLTMNFKEFGKLGTLKGQLKKVEEGWQYESSF